MRFMIMAFSLCVILTGCYYKPMTYQRPWSRFLSQTEIEKGSTLKVVVKCESSPLIGDESLILQEIKDTASNLLRRRGFEISDDSYDYLMKIGYRTKLSGQDNIQLISINQSPSVISYQTYSGYPTILYSQTNIQNSSTSLLATNKIVYEHNFNIEILDRENTCVWKFDTIQNLKSINILDSHVLALQSAFFKLPNTYTYIPKVGKVKKTRAYSYRHLFLQNDSFICPGLPNIIKFPVFLFKIDNPEALIAFHDLLMNAEYVIPSGTEEDWDNLFNTQIWSKAVLVGQYYLGDDTKPTHVSIELSGFKYHYEVKSCKVITRDEFNYYMLAHDKWKSAVSKFFEFSGPEVEKSIKK